MVLPFLRWSRVVTTLVMGFVVVPGCDSAESSFGEQSGGSSGATTAGRGGTSGNAGTTTGGATTGGTAAGGAAGTSPAGGSGGTNVIGENGCTPARMTQIGELRGPYGTLAPSIGGQQYFMQVNQWNSTAPQIMAYGGDYFFKMTQQDAVTSTSGPPTGFPSMFIGANADHVTANSNLPKQVGTLTSVPTTWLWNDNGLMADESANIWNSAYDVWFSTNPAGEPSAYAPSGGYLMVWLYDPPAAQPIGRVLYPGVTVAGVDGTWDVWVGPNAGKPCISYVRTESSLSLSTDLNFFIRDAVENRPSTILDEWYLTNVFIGFEIWQGGAGLETTSFCVTVN
jgi:hypothetical protein